MVTADFAKGAAVTALALAGLLVGFKVQDDMRQRTEVSARTRRRTLARRVENDGALSFSTPRSHACAPPLR
jgi:hypothetical protein